MIKNLCILLLCYQYILLDAQTPKQVQADAIYYNGIIYTVNDSDAIQEAFAIKNGKFLSVGKTQAILHKYTSKIKVDLGGKAVYPGFIDAHCHFYGYGLGLLQLDLVGTKSWQEILDKATHFPKAAATVWLIGRGWDQNDWEDKNYPDNTALNQMFPDQPVVLKRIDGHAVIVNQKALSLAGITAATKIDGGELILKDGKLTGVLIDNAISLLEKAIPKPGRQQVTEALLKAQGNCFAAGITTVDDAGLDLNIVKQIDSLQKKGLLKMNVYAMLNPTPENFAFARQKGVYSTSRLTVRSFKLYADGALGSRGALLKQSYCDQHDHFGLQLQPQSYFDSICKKVYDLQYQVCCHAIGDSANSMMLKAYQPFLYTCRDVEGNDRRAKKLYIMVSNRWRIEHAQVVDGADLHRMLGVVPSVQPTHATSDMYWAKDRLCEQRMPGAYAYRNLLQQSGTIALGTDFPVEDISPVKTFYAAVFRKDARGYPEGGFQPENALTRYQTLQGMTAWAAYANFEENKKGSIEQGKEADFVVLDTDLITAPENMILKTKVLRTVVHGEVVCLWKP